MGLDTKAANTQVLDLPLSLSRGLVTAEIVECNVGAAPRELQSDGLAYATRAPSDQGNLVLKVVAHISSFIKVTLK